MTRPLRLVLGLPVWLYRWRLGRLLDHRFLLLVHRGRRSGRRYENVLEVIHWDPETKESIVMSGFGRRASWLRNIQAGGALEIRIGGSRYFLPQNRVLTPGEAVAVLAGYERRHRVVAPVLHAVLTRLSGIKYDGSDSARARLVAELPLVAFRPGVHEQEPRRRGLTKLFGSTAHPGARAGEAQDDLGGPLSATGAALARLIVRPA